MSGFVYFISDGLGAVKIGFSVNPGARLRALQTAHGDRLVLLGSVAGSMALEKCFHEMFAEYHLRGEWFEAENNDLISKIRDILADPPLVPPDQRLAGSEFSIRLRAFLTRVYPHGTVAHAALDTGIAASTIKKWFERKSDPSGVATLRLIEVYGPAFLEACWFTASVPPPWLDDAAKAVEREWLGEQIAALQAKLERSS